MKYIDAVDGTELHIRESILHVMGKRRHISKDIWIIVGDNFQEDEYYYETLQANRLGFKKFLVIPRSDEYLIQIVEEFGLQNASQSGKQKIIIIDK